MQLVGRQLTEGKEEKATAMFKLIEVKTIKVMVAKSGMAGSD
jgi:hypothetical protein